MTSDAHVTMKNGDETSCVREEGDEVVGELRERSINVDHGLPLFDEVVPVVLVEGERQTLEETELAEGCWNLCVGHACFAFALVMSCFPNVCFACCKLLVVGDVECVRVGLC